VVVNACNPTTLEAKAGDHEFQAILSQTPLPPKKPQTKTNKTKTQTKQKPKTANQNQKQKGHLDL
jgi:hypothetical protein